MTNATHTPGPWIYTGVFCPEGEISYSVHQAKNAPFPIAHDIQTEANVRLIAAVPALLAVAENVLCYLPSQEDLQVCVVIADEGRPHMSFFSLPW